MKAGLFNAWPKALLPRIEDAVGGYERLGNMCQRRILPNVDGTRSTIRFLGATNDKIRVLKAEELVDERFFRKLEKKGRFYFCAIADVVRKCHLITIVKSRTNDRRSRITWDSNPTRRR